MTAYELTELVRGCDPRKLVDALAPLKESQRKSLSKTTVELMRSYQQASQNYRAMVDLAVLGLCGWGNARRARPILYGDMRRQDWVANILIDRRPEWLDKWVQLQLDSPFFFEWAEVRHLVRAGVCERPADDRYIACVLFQNALTIVYIIRITQFCVCQRNT